MKRALVVLAVILAVALPVAASASSRPSAAPKPHIIGTWPNDVSLSQAGGYEVWSNGQVKALGHAPYYGSVSAKVNDIVGFAADDLSGGYWLIGANGAVYGRGSTCQDEKLVGPKGRPKSGVIGAINTPNDDEGFDMITAAGHSYSFTCQFVF